MAGYTPADYMKFLTPHDPDGPTSQPHAHFWRKAKKGTTTWLTLPIIRDSAVMLLARLFGVTIGEVVWPARDTKSLAITCEVGVSGYNPITPEQARALLQKGEPIPLAKDWPVPPSTMQIGEVNQDNAGMTGRQYPQIFAFKRARDRAILEHLGLFDCYGDVEAPEFAETADYEQTREQQAQPASAPVVSVRGSEWATQPPAVMALLKTLMQERGVTRQTVDMLYRDCNGEPDSVMAALESIGRQLDKRDKEVDDGE